MSAFTSDSLPMTEAISRRTLLVSVTKYSGGTIRYRSAKTPTHLSGDRCRLYITDLQHPIGTVQYKFSGDHCRSLKYYIFFFLLISNKFPGDHC